MHYNKKTIHNMRKIVFLLLLPFLSLIVLPKYATAQLLGSMNPATMQIDNLTDEQVSEINERIQSQGLSIDEALELARAQGLPAAEITKLRMRLAVAGTSMGDTALETSDTEIPLIEIEDTVEEIPTLDELQSEPAEARVSNLTESREVQEIIEDSRIFGHSIFTDQTIDFFTTTDGARAPDWYVLGSNDQIRITIFGVSQADLMMEVSDDGYIQPTGMPRIFLKGLTIHEAERLLRDRLSDFYTFKNEEFSLTIKAARTITINIFGEVRARGSFTISALNTALNALSIVGGPTEIGSVRSIQLIRGQERKEIDLYEFMNDPSVQTEYDLRHNDILFVPVAKKVVTLEGAVKRPMRYELKDGEGVLDLLEYAGGINFNTVPNFLQIQRIEDGEPRLMEYDLSDLLSQKQNMVLQDGDIIRIRQISKTLEKFVEISGAVYYPGVYDLNENRRLSQLLLKAELLPEAVQEKVIIKRTKLDGTVLNMSVSPLQLTQSGEDFLLEPEDLIQVFNQEQYSDVDNVEIAGSVRSPVAIPLEFGDRLRLADAIFLAEGLNPTAASDAFVFRRELFNPEIMNHIRVDVTRDADFELQAGDRLVVYDQSNYTNLGELSVSGAIGNPLNVVFDPSLTITDLLWMAGGVTPNAALNRVDLYRLDVSYVNGTSYSVITLEIDDSLNVVRAPSNFQLQPYDRIIVRMLPEFNPNTDIQIEGQVRYPGNYPLESQKVRLSDIIIDAGGLTNTADPRNAIIFRSYNNIGPIAVDLEKAMSTATGDNRHDPVLFDNDIITIPKLQNTVTIRIDGTRVGDLSSFGVVDTETEIGGNREINVIYKGSRSARWYIRNFAGGFADDADKWSVTVTKANGEVMGTDRSLLLFRNYPKVEPGSTITLRNKPEELATEEEVVDWDEVQARSIQLTSTLLTLLILFDRLSGTN